MLYTQTYSRTSKHCMHVVHVKSSLLFSVFLSLQLVTGEANFSMDCTSLTIGGFTQPAVARPLIEMPANVEKGFSSQFLWYFPKPCYSKFETLEPVESDFTKALGMKYLCTYTLTGSQFQISAPNLYMCNLYFKMVP